MTEVIGVRFREVGKVYYFDPDNLKFSKYDKVIVETARGIECGEVMLDNKEVNDEEIVKPLKKVIRKATENDLEKAEQNRESEKKAMEICRKKVEKYNLEMKLVNVEYTFDSSKIIFYFTAENRVDFRELVKDLASVFRTRIELRQIGVRDESKMVGGLGMCGRPLCCESFLSEFMPVSIKMAKEQNLSLNPTKISGTCGRLMCCLNYEQSTYEHLSRVTPKVGAIVSTKDGKGVVEESNIIRGIVKVRLDVRREAAPQSYDSREVKIIKDGDIKLSKEELDSLKDIEN